MYPPARSIRFHRIISQCPRPPRHGDPGALRFPACPPRLARNARTYEIELVGADAEPTGTAARRDQGSSDELRSRARAAHRVRRRRAALDDWEKFDMPGLRAISRTAPYFHNNSAATLEEVVDHYIEFFKRVEANYVRRGLCRRSRRPTACISIDGRLRKSGSHSWHTCANCGPQFSRLALEPVSGLSHSETHAASSDSFTLRRVNREEDTRRSRDAGAVARDGNPCCEWP